MDPPRSSQGLVVAQNAGLNFLGQAVPLVTSFLVMPFLIQGLGMERLGLLSLGWIFLNYSSLFDLGFGRASSKAIAESLGKGASDQLLPIVWSSLIFNTILGVIGGSIFASLIPLLTGRIIKIPPLLAKEATLSFLALAVIIPLVVTGGTLRCVLEGARRFDLVNLVRSTAGSLMILLPAVGVLLGFHLIGIILLIGIVTLGSTLAYLMLSFRILPSLTGNLSFDVKIIRRLLVFGGWITVSNAAGPIVTYGDRFLISSLLTMNNLTHYAIASDLVIRLWIIPTSLVMVLFPTFSMLNVMDRPRLAVYYVKALKYLACTMGPITLILAIFAKDILTFWLGSEFADESATLLQVLSVGGFINSLASVPYTLLQGINRPDVTAKIHLAELPLATAGSWWFIERMGTSGAAWAWTLRMAAEAVALFVASWRSFPSVGSAVSSDGLLGSLRRKEGGKWGPCRK